MMADADPESFGLTKMRSVGFADLVNFTALVRRLSERDLARLVSRFEALSADVITAHGGRLIKTVGDEVLFTTVGAAPAAAIALDLVDTMAEDDVLPDVRCGMARGPIVSRLGDVFGTTVNRASRLTAVAGAGSVLVDATMARELASMSGFTLTGQRRRVLRGVGAVTPSVLRRRVEHRPPRPLRAARAANHALYANQGESVCRPAPTSCASTVSRWPVSSTSPRSSSTGPRR